jgi:hypothetical protein
VPRTSTLPEEMLDAIGAESGDDEQLSRALSIAPHVIAAAGIQPIGRDTNAFSSALDHVLGEAGRASSEQPYEQLSAIADQLEEEMKRRGITTDLAALATAYMTPREDAAYSLGLAVGLTFARCLDDAPPITRT